MDPVRVAVVSTHPAHYHAPFYRELARSEVLAPTVLYTDRARCESYRDPDLGALETGIDRFEGYPWELVEPRLGGAVGAAGAVARRILAGRFDAAVLVALNQAASWAGLAACRFAGVIAIAKGEGDLLRGREGFLAELKGHLRRLFGAGVHRAIYSCSANREYFLDAGVEEDHLIFVPAAVDNDHYTRIRQRLTRPELRRELGVTGEAVFLYVGRLTERKRASDLLEAWKQVEDAGRSRRLVVVGDGPRRSQVERRAAGRDDVTFTGTLAEDELVRWYEAADVLVVPSSWDPSPKVLNEAMNFGNACLASDRVGSALDLVAGGENGFLYRMGAVGELADRIASMTSLPEEELARMGERSREIVADWTFERGRRELEVHLGERHGAVR